MRTVGDDGAAEQDPGSSWVDYSGGTRWLLAVQNYLDLYLIYQPQPLLKTFYVEFDLQSW